MAESWLKWTGIQEQADKPLSDLVSVMKEAASKFGAYPEDPLERRQFEIRVQETAFDWARSATKIYCKALADTGGVLSDSTAQILWHNGLGDFVQYRIKPQVELAFRFGELDRQLLSAEPVIICNSHSTAWSKTKAISSIIAYLQAYAQPSRWWMENCENALPDAASTATPKESGEIAPSTPRLDPNIEFGKWAEERLRDARSFSRLVHSGQPPQSLREKYPRLFSEVFDKLTEPRRASFFEDAQRRKLAATDLRDVIGDVKGYSGSTLKDYVTRYNRSRKQSS